MSSLRSRLAGGGGVLLIAAGAVLVWGPAAGPAQGSTEVGRARSGGGLAQAAPLPPVGTMAISPATQNVALGSGAFTVDVGVSNVQDLGAYDITMKFNPNILEYVSSQTGHYLTSTGRTESCTRPRPDPHGGTVEENVNKNGALHFACNTFGLGTPGSGVSAGPSGSGVVGSVTFRPKAVGNADLTLEGYKSGEAYLIRAPGADVVVDGTPYADRGETGQTGLAYTNGDDELVPPPVSAIVAVYDPSQPTPTGVPATPTPRSQPSSDVQATVRAVLGTPERTLATPAPGQPGSTGSSGGAGEPAGTIRADGSVAGASTGGGGSGSGSSGAGSSGGASGSGLGAGAGARGPNGAPIAGYGPQPREHSRLPLNAGLLMIALGTLALTAGVLHDRRRA